MDKYYKKIQKIFCVFFMLILCLESSLMIVQGAVEPPWDIISTGGNKIDATGAEVNFEYHFHRQSYDRYTGEAIYEVKETFWTNRPTVIYTDYLYVNGDYIGEFASYNGSYKGGTATRSERYTVIFREGKNLIETTGGGVGGDSRQFVYIDKFTIDNTAPVVHGIDGIWLAGEVTSGKRTWASLYTDGATGSVSGNEKQTSTGFTYTDAEEQYSPVGAYSDTVLGKNASIVKIVNTAGTEVRWSALDQPGIYTIYSQTSDSGGLIGTGFRKVKVMPKTTPNIKGEDRWFYIDEIITNEDLLEKVTAHDPVQGNISHLIKIKHSNVQSGVAGDYEVTYKVTNDFGQSAETTNQIHIIKRMEVDINQSSYLRFIDAENENTIKSQSTWRTADRAALLHQTLHEPDVEEIWVLSPENIEQIKKFNQEHDFSKESNESFIELFANLRK